MSKKPPEGMGGFLVTKKSQRNSHALKNPRITRGLNLFFFIAAVTIIERD